MHIGIFRSSRPTNPADPKGEQTWTVIDGGQSPVAEIQMSKERNRYFNPVTQILSTKLADGGQEEVDKNRSLRGWIDIEVHFKLSAPEAIAAAEQPAPVAEEPKKWPTFNAGSYSSLPLGLF